MRIGEYTSDDVVASIEEVGYCVLEKYISNERLNAFMPEVYRRFSRQSFNGTIGYVAYAHQKYLQHTLTVHDEILRICLDPFIIECCEKYGREAVHLGDYRIYQNLSGSKMAWHVDNKLTLPDGTSRMLELKGLILLVYLEDINHGPFQFIRKSHTWAWQHSREEWDEDIAQYKDDIVTFNNLPAGTALLYDVRGIHRAEPFYGQKPRTALFAQYPGVRSFTGEPIVLDASMLGTLTEKERSILRFGKTPSCPTWPIAADAPQKAIPVPTARQIVSKAKTLVSRPLERLHQ